MKLETGLGFKKGRRGRITFPGAKIQLDATIAKSAISNSSVKDLITGNLWAASNMTGTDTGTPAGKWAFGGNTRLQPVSANYGLLSEFGKTTAGLQYTQVFTGALAATGNRYLATNVSSAALTDGWGIYIGNDREITVYQWKDGANVNVNPVAPLVTFSDNFIIIYTYDVDTQTYRLWVNGYLAAEGTFAMTASSDTPSQLFTLGGLANNTAMFVGDLYAYLVLDKFIDSDKAADIIQYYENLHQRQYAPFYVGWMGQSNAAYMFTQYGGAGNTAFVSELESASGLQVESINGAVGGASLLQVNDTNPYGHYLTSSNERGDVYDTLETALGTASKKAVKYIIWDQGETDGTGFGASDNLSNYAAYKAGLQTLFGFLRSDYRKAKFIFHPTAKNTNVNNRWGGYRDVRKAQLEFIAENGNVYYTPTRADLTMADNTHQDQAGYELHGERVAARIAGLIAGDQSGTIGPQITRAEFIDGTDTVILTVTTDGADLDTAPSFETGYWGIIKNGSVITVDDAVSNNPNEITLTSSETLAAEDEVFVLHHNGTMFGCEPTSSDSTQKHWQDTATSPLPLAPARIAAAEHDNLDILADNLVLYTDPSNAENYDATGSDVNYALDLSQSGNFLVPVDGAALPTISTNFKRFGFGIDKGFETPGQLLQDGANEIFFVATPTSGTPSSAKPLFHNPATSGTGLFRVYSGGVFAPGYVGSFNVSYNNGSSDFGGGLSIANTGVAVYHLRITAAGVFEMSVNGGAYSELFDAGGVFVAPDDQFAIGRNLTTGVQFYGGQLGAVAVYHGNMPQIFADNIIAKMANDYGISTGNFSLSTQYMDAYGVSYDTAITPQADFTVFPVPNIVTEYPLWMGYKELLAQQIHIACPLERTTTYYIDASGGDDGGAGTEADPWQTIARINTAMAPDTRFRLKCGEVWEDQTTLLIDEANVTVDSYGTGDKPLLNYFTEKFPATTSWTAAGGDIYYIAYASVVNVGGIRFSDDRLMEGAGETFAYASDAAGTGATGANLWYFRDTVNDRLYVYTFGDDPTDYNIEVMERNTISGIRVNNVNGVRVEGIRVDGYSHDPFGTVNHNLGYNFITLASAGKWGYFKDCEGYYGSAHIMGMLVSTDTGGNILFDGCISGLPPENGINSETIFNHYSRDGGGAGLYYNCTVAYGTLRNPDWTWSTKRSLGRGFYGHTAGGDARHDLYIVHGCTVSNSHTPARDIGGMANPTLATDYDDPATYRSFIVGCTHEEYDDISDVYVTLASNCVHYGNLYSLKLLKNTNPAAFNGNAGDSIVANCVFDINFDGQSTIYMALLNSTSDDNRIRFVNTNVLLRGGTSMTFGVNYDDLARTTAAEPDNATGFTTNTKFYRSVWAYNTTTGTAKSFAADNRAVSIIDSAFFDVDHFSPAGQVRDYDNGVNNQEATGVTLFWPEYHPLLDNTAENDLPAALTPSHDFFGNERVSNDIGAIDFTASAGEWTVGVDSIAEDADLGATSNDNAIFHDAFTVKRVDIVFYTDFETFSNQRLLEVGGANNGYGMFVTAAGNLEWAIWTGSSLLDTLVAPLENKSFYRASFIWDGTSTLLYLNGNLIDSGGANAVSTSHSDAAGLKTSALDTWSAYSSFGDGDNLIVQELSIWRTLAQLDPDYSIVAENGALTRTNNSDGAYVRYGLSYLPDYEFSPDHIWHAAAWYDVQDTATLSTTTDGADVSQVNDKIGTNHLIQDAARNLPSYDASAQALRFVGADQETLLTTNNVGLTAVWSCFSVWKAFSADVSGQEMYVTYDDNSDECGFGPLNSTSQYVFVGQGAGLSVVAAVSTSGLLDGTAYSTVIERSSTTSTRHRVNNGTPVASATTINAQDGKMRVGCGYVNSGYTRFANASMCEHITFTQPLSPSERKALQTYMNTKWS